MSSDRLERKRRSEFDISDDESADEQRPAKIRKAEQASYFSRVLTEKVRSILSWFSPKTVKDYMIDFVRRSFNQPNNSAANMRVEGITNVDDDDDEIAVVAVQNGTSSVRSRITGGQKFSNCQKASRHINATNCPLVSTPLNIPMLPSSSGLIDKTKFLERRQMNGFANREDASKRKRKEGDNWFAPITNPSSDIEILLETKTKPFKTVSPRSHKIHHYDYSSKERTKHSEQLIKDLSHSFSRSHSNFTALEVVRLKEKEEYRLLLNKVVKQTIYHPVPRREKQDSIVQVDLTEDDSKPIQSYHFKKEKVAHVAGFFNHFKPIALVPYKTAQSIDYTKQDNSIKKGEDDDEILGCTDLPKFTPRRKFSESNGGIFSQEWINELKTSIESDKRKHLQLISEQNDKLQRYKKRRDAKIAEEQKRRDEQRLAGVILPDDDEMEEDVLPEITPEMESIIVRALAPGDPNEQLSSINTSLSLTRNDLATLSKLNWLNDQVINCYLTLIAERSKLDNYPSVHVFNTFFYTSLKTKGPSGVLRWTRRIDIFAFDQIIVPLHLGMHWALLFVDNRNKSIRYYDSMGSSEEKCLRIMGNYLVVEMQDKKKIILDPDTYSQETPKDIPKQMNGSDCGMFTLKYAEYLSRDALITFTQENMPYFRRRMVYELLSRQIL